MITAWDAEKVAAHVAIMVLGYYEKKDEYPLHNVLYFGGLNKTYDLVNFRCTLDKKASFIVLRYSGK